MWGIRMNRRAFIGAFAALLALPAVALSSRSVPRFATSGCRLSFSPHGELDWIEFPSHILSVWDYSEDILMVRCLDGTYALSHAGGPSNWFVKQVM